MIKVALHIFQYIRRYGRQLWRTYLQVHRTDQASSPQEELGTEPAPPEPSSAREELGTEPAPPEPSSAREELGTEPAPPEPSSAREELGTEPAPPEPSSAREELGTEPAPPEPSSAREELGTEPAPPEPSSAREELGTEPAPPEPSSAREELGTEEDPPGPPKPIPIPHSSLICRKSRGSIKWEIILPTTDEYKIEKMQHDNQALGITGNECLLSSFSGNLLIEYKDREATNLQLCNNTPMIFKFQGSWNGDGQKVSHMASGYFIVIAPRGWTRIDAAGIEQEECADRNFVAHYFYLPDEPTQINKIGFHEYQLPISVNYKTCLSGNLIFDNSTRGKLYTGSPPELTTAYRAVRAQIGEDRSDGWKSKEFDPAQISLKEILDGRQGHFSLRIFDGTSKRPATIKFRYLANIQKIMVNGELYTEDMLLVPNSNGHSLANVQFVGTNDTPMKPNILTSAPQVYSQSNDIIIAQPCRDEDDISCSLTSGLYDVQIVIRLPRVWWRLESAGNEGNKWQSIPWKMTRQAYREYASKNACIHLHVPSSIESIHIGLNNELNQQMRNYAGGMKISLINFIDYPQIAQRLNEHTSLNIQLGKTTLTLIEVSPDPKLEITSFTIVPTAISVGEQATLHWVTQAVESDSIMISPDIGAIEPYGRRLVSPRNTTIFTLALNAVGMDSLTRQVALQVLPRSQEVCSNFLVSVKRPGGGYRRGKGFSRGEVLAACAMNGHPHLNVSIDRRRRSTHQTNVETIRSLLDA